MLACLCRHVTTPRGYNYVTSGVICTFKPLCCQCNTWVVMLKGQCVSMFTAESCASTHDFTACKSLLHTFTRHKNKNGGKVCETKHCCPREKQCLLLNVTILPMEVS